MIQNPGQGLAGNRSAEDRSRVLLDPIGIIRKYPGDLALLQDLPGHGRILAQEETGAVHDPGKAFMGTASNPGLA